MPCENCVNPRQDNLALCGVEVKDPPASRYATMRCLACGQFYVEYISPRPAFYSLAYKAVPIRSVLCKKRAKENCTLTKNETA